MFTGIIEAVGSIKEVLINGTNHTYWIESPVSSLLKVDQSVSHNGVCLTVEELRENAHRVTAIAETINKTNIASWRPNDAINLERCLRLDSLLDGHLVQGHVDCKARCTSIMALDGSWNLEFQFPAELAHLVIEKGSITVNGISLTAHHVGLNSFTVSVIPFTYNHTNISSVIVGDSVNIEFDVIGKYLDRWRSLAQSAPAA